MKVDVAALRTKVELLALKKLLGVSYGLAPDLWGTWLERIGKENIRVARADGAVAGGLGMYRFGHFFGGKSVKAAGIAGVGVGPENRAGGVAKELLACTLRELHEEGTPLATLFASTQYLYRSVGFEHAGQMVRYRAPVASLRPESHEGLPITRLDPLSADPLQAIYSPVARVAAGYLDRDAAIWARTLQVQGADETHVYLFGPIESPEGYVVYTHVRVDPLLFDIQARDLQWTTPRAARAILRFFYDQRSLARDLLWKGPPSEPLLLLVAEQTERIDKVYRLFARITHVKRALEARGYAGEGELSLLVEDPIVPANAGAWTLSVRGKRGRAKKGGRGDLALSIGALASLYSGMYSATQLAHVGAVRGRPSVLAQAERVFAGPVPSICDMF